MSNPLPLRCNAIRRIVRPLTTPRLVARASGLRPGAILTSSTTDDAGFEGIRLWTILTRSQEKGGLAL